MRCGLSRSDHWEEDGRPYLNSPMYHCEDRCPYRDGDCIMKCGKMQAPTRPCLFEDYFGGLEGLQVVRDARGMAAVEYAIILVGVAAAIVLGVSLFGSSVKALFERAAQIFSGTP